MGTNRLGSPQETGTEPTKEQFELELLAHSIQFPQEQQQQQANPIEIRTADSEYAAGPQATEPKDVVQPLIDWTETSGQQPTQLLTYAAGLQTEEVISPAYQQNKLQNFSSAHQNACLGKRVLQETHEIMLPPVAKLFSRESLGEVQQPSKPSSLHSLLSAGFFDDFCQPGEDFTGLKLTTNLMPVESSLETRQASLHEHLQSVEFGDADRVVIEEG